MELRVILMDIVVKIDRNIYIKLVKKKITKGLLGIIKKKSRDWWEELEQISKK